jgi:hypothetical protein
MAAPRKVIIDTDPGIDDSMCIFMALRSMEPAFRAAHPTYTPLDVVGLTTVFGAILRYLSLLESLIAPDLAVALTERGEPAQVTGRSRS